MSTCGKQNLSSLNIINYRLEIFIKNSGMLEGFQVKVKSGSFGDACRLLLSQADLVNDNRV